MRRAWPKAVHIAIVLALPIALLAISLRVVTAEWLLHWEYGKPGFPPDPYGLTNQERTRLAGVCVEYLVSDAGIDLLEDLRLEGQPAFNQRELRHMVDVKRVLKQLLWVGLGAGIMVVAGTAGLAIRGSQRAPVALLGGSMLSLGLLFAVGGLMLVGWETFFVGFHRVFFSGDTWLFPTSDTLIRLFPERFWMDVGLLVVALLAGQALVIGAGAYAWLRLQPSPDAGTES